MSASFAVDVDENWQSEYLQFLVYILATVWLLQIGSPEFKELDKPGEESDEEQKVGEYAEPSSPLWAAAPGLRRVVFSWSLALVMGLIFRAVLVRPVLSRLGGVQRDQAAATAGSAELGEVPAQRGLLGLHPAELAVGIPRCGLDGGPQQLPPAARLLAEQAGRSPHEATGIEG